MDCPTQLSLLNFTTNLLASSIDERYLPTGVGTPNNVWEIFFKPGTMFEPPFVYYLDDAKAGYFSFFIYESGRLARESPVYLSDDLSRKFQLFINHRYDYDIFFPIQENVFYVLYFYNQIVEFRMFLYWFLMFNQYQIPFNILPFLTNWFFRLSNAAFPMICGVSIGTTGATFILGLVVEAVHHLVLTIPYLPSEGILYGSQELIDNVKEAGLDMQIFPYSDIVDSIDLRKYLEKENELVRLYQGFPYMYNDNPIPNWLREHWWTNEPHITRNLIETKSEFLQQNDITVVPNRISEELARRAARR